MAKITSDGCSELISVFKDLGGSIDGILKMGVYEGAGIVYQAIRDECPVDTGGLRASLGISKIRSDADGVNTVISFDGYDDNQVPYQLKARVIESGAHGVKKNPFVRRAVNRVKQQALDGITKTIDDEIEKLIGGK